MPPPLAPPVPGAPWTFPPRRLAPVPEPVGPQVYAQRFLVGPPVKGAPWVRTRTRYPDPPDPGPPPPQVVARRFIAGPPVPGAPWGRRYHDPRRFVRVPPPGDRPPSPGAPSIAKGFVPRMRDESDLTRARRAIDVLSVMVNSLLGQGHIQLTGQQTYAIRGGAFPATRAPLATDDATQGVSIGSWWVNTSTGLTYICTNNAAGGAVWVAK